jgi:hypothetical protein
MLHEAKAAFAFVRVSPEQLLRYDQPNDRIAHEFERLVLIYLFAVFRRLFIRPRTMRQSSFEQLRRSELVAKCPFKLR